MLYLEQNNLPTICIEISIFQYSTTHFHRYVPAWLSNLTFYSTVISSLITMLCCWNKFQFDKFLTFKVPSLTLHHSTNQSKVGSISLCSHTSSGTNTESLQTQIHVAVQTSHFVVEETTFINNNTYLKNKQLNRKCLQQDMDQCRS